MAGIVEMINMLPKVIDIILKLTLLSIALFFGRIAISGWRGKLDFITKFIGAILVGFICFAVGILLPFEFIPSIRFISDMVNSFIVAIIIYVILLLLSIKSKPDVLTKKDVLSLEKEIDFLKGEIAKINRALIEKGIEPKAATESDVRKAVIDAIKKAGMDNYKILSLDFKETHWVVNVSISGRKYVAIVDEAGNVKEFQKQGFEFGDVLDRMKKDKFFLSGVIIAVLFTFFVFSLLTPSNLERVSKTFSFYGVELPNEKTSACLGTVNLLKKWSEGEIASYGKYSLEGIDNSIDNYLNKDMYASPYIYSHQLFVEYNGTTYGAFFVYNESINSMPVFLTALQKSLLSGGGYICSVNMKDSSVCDCKPVNDPTLAVEITDTLNKLSQQGK
jgi:hypothetical protein